MIGPALVVLSREAAEAYIPRDREVCISVTDPNTPEPRLSDKFAAICYFKFHDIDERVPLGELVDDARPAVHFDDYQADRIVRFAAKYHDVDVVVVHCEAGVSRSRSIAEALFDAFDRRAPNQWVYQRIENAFKRLYNELEVHWINFRWRDRKHGNPKAESWHARAVRYRTALEQIAALRDEHNGGFICTDIAEKALNHREGT